MKLENATAYSGRDCLPGAVYEQFGGGGRSSMIGGIVSGKGKAEVKSVQLHGDTQLQISDRSTGGQLQVGDMPEARPRGEVPLGPALLRPPGADTLQRAL